MKEKWREFYSDEQLKKIQEIELENLKAFISVCEKLELDYFLYGGTLLGAVKYHGFVPWDDDIDIALPRESYERLIKEGPQVIPESYFLQNPYNCKECPYPYTKWRKRGTKYVEYSNRNLPIETGIYMDIYPVDRIPVSEKDRKRQFNSVRRWIFVYVCRQSRLYDKEEHGIKGHIKNVARFIACNLLKIFPQKYCIGQIDKYMKMYNKEGAGRCAALNSPNYDNIYDAIYPLERGKFNDIDVLLPNDYQSHLERRYGDINLLPPDEEKVGHIPYILEM